MYADYEYYRDMFGLNKLTEPEFILYGTKASDYVDYVTLGRAGGYAEHVNVKKCCCCLAEILKKHSKGKSITSEKSGNWSASYNNVSKTSELSECVRIYLAPLGLLYRGIG